MKTTFKFISAAVVASSLIASSAFAGDPLGSQRMAERNADYFQKSGTRMASASSSFEPSESDATSPSHRMGKRNAEYFSGKATDAGSAPAVKPVSHPTKH